MPGVIHHADVHEAGVTNGTSDVTIPAAPASGTIKRVSLITVDNIDSATATVRIFYVNGANSRRLISKALTTNTNMEYPTVGEPIVLDATNTSLKLNLAGAVSATELDWTVHLEEFDGEGDT